MSLPVISHPTFEIVVPSTKKKHRFRPFFVGEEKILLIAQQGGNDNDIIYSIKQIINNCCLDKLDTNTLAPFDMEYLFIQLRARSVNNIIKQTYQDKEDGKFYSFDIDLYTIEPIDNPDHHKKIRINDDSGLILKYPDAVFNELTISAPNEPEALYQIIKTCLDKVWVGEEIYNFSEATNEEIDVFMNNSVDVRTFQAIQEFLETMPKIRHVIEYTNELGNPRKIVLEKLEDFFSFR
jgi:hypothetical protein